MSYKAKFDLVCSFSILFDDEGWAGNLFNCFEIQVWSWYFWKCCISQKFTYYATLFVLLVIYSLNWFILVKLKWYLLLNLLLGMPFKKKSPYGGKMSHQGGRGSKKTLGIPYLKYLFTWELFQGGRGSNHYFIIPFKIFFWLKWA